MKAQESSPGYDVLAQSASSDEWTLVPLKNLGTWSGGGTPSKSKPEYWEDGAIPWVSPKDMKTDRIRDSEDHITEQAVNDSTANLIDAGSVLLVTRSGILRHTLPVAVTTLPVTVNQDLKALTPREGILPDYVAWALRANGQEILNTCSKQGTTVNSLETSRLMRFEIPVAPLVQQKRIVAEIEKQFSRLDESVANLKRVKANLKRYKAAVLKAAVEGRLVETEAERARREGRSYETGAQLLQRILEIRRSQWKGKGKYKEPAAPDTTDLPELPEGWAWLALNQFALLENGDRSKNYPSRAEFVDEGVPFINAGHLEDGRIDMAEMNFIPEERFALLRAGKVREEDLLFCLRGSLGKVAIVSGIDSGAIASSLVIVRPTADVIPGYLLCYFMSPLTHDQIQLYDNGSAQPNLSAADLGKFVVPIPPVATQRQIVAEVDRLFSILRETEAQVDANLQRGECLRQSILQWAFTK